MGYGKILVLLFTVGCLALSCLVWQREPEEAGLSFRLGEETYRCQGQWGEYGLYLPGYGDLEEVTLSLSGEVTVDGVPLADTKASDVFRWDTPHWVETEGEDFTLTLYRSGQVPALHLNVASGSMDYLHEDKNHTEPGTLRLYDSDGNLLESTRFDALTGRGSSTWAMEKKPYNLEFSADTDLLGLGAAKKWVLLANACDDSQLRNALVYGAAARLGLDYTPETAYVDLYLNGEYAGLYLLCERNEIHRERVDLAGDEYFLVSKEWEWRMEGNGQSYVQLASNAALRIHGSNMTNEQIQSLFQQAENAILSPDGTDPETGRHFRELIDVDSWVRKYLLEECFGNVDGGTLSQFFWYDGDKIHAGPVWDYDLTLGNSFAYPYPSANMFYVNREGVYASHWFPALYENPEFFDRLCTLYETEFRPVLEQLAESGLEEMLEAIAPAAEMNARRWPGGDFRQAAADIREYLTGRIAFLDAIWGEREEFLTVQVITMDDTILRYMLRPGETLPQLPQYEDTDTVTVHGWYDKATGEPVDVTKPLYESCQIALDFALTPVEAPPEEPLSPAALVPGAALVLSLGALALRDRKRNRYE